MAQKSSKKILIRNFILLVPFIIALLVLGIQVSATAAQETEDHEASALESSGMGLIAAGLAVGLSGIGAGIAIFGSTSAGMAAMVERPELNTWVLIFAGLGEGLAIYGLVVAIMILGKI
ncbi:MAG: ATP synthase subunit C [Candidatus Bathyarchaeia archaeon]|jgi:V/A-type H+-transporting ATPase subunit K